MPRSHLPDGPLTGFQGDCQERCDHIVIQKGQDGAVGAGTQSDPKPLRTNIDQITTQTHTYKKQHLNSFLGQLGQLGLITKIIRVILYSTVRTLSNINKHTYKPKYLHPISFLQIGFSAFVSVLAVVPSGSY